MLIQNTMIKYRLKRSSKKLFTGIFRSLHNCSDERSTTARNQIIQQCYKKDVNTLFGSRTILSPEFSRQICIPNYLKHHCYSTYSHNELPDLTDLPVQIRPYLLSELKCLLIQFLTIRPQLDREFSLVSFQKTSDKVIQVISNRLAECDYDGLEDMVTPDVFSQIKKNLPYFTESQRQELVMKLEDVAMSFIYDIQITESANQMEKFLQITTVHHVVKGAEELRKLFQNFTPFNMMQMQPLQQQGAPDPFSEIKKKALLKGFVANCRFLRVFNVEMGTAGDWIINGLNYRTKKMDF